MNSFQHEDLSVFRPAIDSTHSPNILVVEDDEPMALLLKYNLISAGCNVEAINSGLEADRRISNSPPDLVVLDWGLPGLSGVEVLRRLRAKPQTTRMPVLMLTARSDPDDQKFGLDLGANVFLVKPFNLSEFLDSVFQLLAATIVRPPRQPGDNRPRNTGAILADQLAC